MKRLETTEKQIGENTFYITPFPAFKAARISGELTALLTPILSGVVPTLAEKVDTEGDGADSTPDIMNSDIKEILPAITNALGNLTGDKIESIMTALLIDGGNIAVSGEATDGEVKKLTRDLADEVFCLDLQDMYILAYEVVKMNFSGFFGKIAARFGSQLQGMKMGTQASASMAASI